MLAPEGPCAPECVRQRVLPVLVQRVQPTAGTTLSSGDVLVLPPPVDEPQRRQPTQRSVDRDLLDPQTVRDLKSVELGAALAMETQAVEQHLRIELEQESTARSGHLTPNRRLITP